MEYEGVKEVRWGDYFSFLIEHPECRCLTEWGDESLARTVKLWSEAAALEKGDRILDIGCGFGYYAVELARQGFEVTAVERVGSFLEGARRRAASYGVEVEWVEGTFPRIDLQHQFRAAVLANGFELWDDAKLVAEAIKELLEPGGRLIADAPGKPQWEEDVHFGAWSYQGGAFFNRKTGRGVSLKAFLPDEGRQAQLEKVKETIEEVGFTTSICEVWLIAKKKGGGPG